MVDFPILAYSGATDVAVFKNGIVLYFFNLSLVLYLSFSQIGD